MIQYWIAQNMPDQRREHFRKISPPPPLHCLVSGIHTVHWSRREWLSIHVNQCRLRGFSESRNLLSQHQPAPFYDQESQIRLGTGIVSEWELMDRLNSQNAKADLSLETKYNFSLLSFHHISWRWCWWWQRQRWWWWCFCDHNHQIAAASGRSNLNSGSVSIAESPPMLSSSSSSSSTSSSPSSPSSSSSLSSSSPS